MCVQASAGAAAPRGANTWDGYAEGLNETSFLAMAASLSTTFLPFGYDTATVDGGWNTRDGGAPVMDAYGRPSPDLAKFPSAAGGRGLRPLSDAVHALGLRFGAWVIRGVPVAAVEANLPIEGSRYRARDAVRLDKNCTWDAATLGTNAPSAAATAWYESLARGFAAQGLDFVKADCMWPGSVGGAAFDEDVAAFASAFARVAPQIAISWSPGDGMTFANGSFVAARGGAWGVMYRVTPDFHESWPALAHHLDVAAEFAPLIGANGTFPDLDMLPLGRQAPDGHRTAYSAAEQQLLMTLWAIVRAPLIIGARLPLDADDGATLALLTNAAVLAVNNGTRGNAPVAVQLPTGQSNTTALHAWTAVYEAVPAATAVALFNARDEPATLGAALPAGGCARNLWSGADEGAVQGGVLSRTLQPHSAGLWAVAPTCSGAALPGGAAWA
jgi:hypothetical protein